MSRRRQMISQEEIDEARQKAYRNDKGALIVPPNPFYQPYWNNYSHKLLTAGYARVSTDNEAQAYSYDLQCKYFKELIEKEPNWEFVGIYADEGLSGTSMKRRVQFRKMIDDALSGKIDLIVTKSVSRFSRNVVDLLDTIRRLSNASPRIGVMFEMERINTLSSSDEMILTFIALFAQAESANKSESMYWSLERRFKEKRFLCPTNALLGYDKDTSGNIVIDPYGCFTVRLIYTMFLSGYSCNQIAYKLTSMQCPTGKGNVNWNPTSVLNILRNERYCGDVFAQKTYTESYLSHRKRPNRGEKQGYFGEQHHEGIITEAEYNRAQVLLDTNRISESFDPTYTLTVIKEGLLAGFIPINRAFGGYKLRHYIYVSKKGLKNGELREWIHKLVKINTDLDEQLKMISYPGYRMATSKYFSDQKMPNMLITPRTVEFNYECMRLLDNVEYAEILFNPIERIIAIRETTQDNIAGFLWSGRKGTGGFKLSCVGFTPILYQLMKWSGKWKLRAVPEVFDNNNQRVLMFDLADAIYRIPVAQNNDDNVPTNDKIGIADEEGGEFGEDIIAQAMPLRKIYSKVLQNWQLNAPSVDVDEFILPTKELPEDITRLIEKNRGIFQLTAVTYKNEQMEIYECQQNG